MTTETIKEIYRVRLEDTVCRSGEALAAMFLREVPGVETVSIDREGTLLVLSTRSESHDDIVGAVVNAGFSPRSVTRSPYERLVDRAPLSLADAISLGDADLPKPPVRAEVETLQVQRITVRVTDGYDPADIIVKAGVPVEITFSEGHGCLAQVMFETLGIEAGLENGGATLRLPALEPGVYPFNCGMRMVHGTVTAE